MVTLRTPGPGHQSSICFAHYVCDVVWAYECMYTKFPFQMKQIANSDPPVQAPPPLGRPGLGVWQYKHTQWLAGHYAYKVLGPCINYALHKGCVALYLHYLHGSQYGFPSLWWRLGLTKGIVGARSVQRLAGRGLDFWCGPAHQICLAQRMRGPNMYKFYKYTNNITQLYLTLQVSWVCEPILSKFLPKPV